MNTEKSSLIKTCTFQGPPDARYVIDILRFHPGLRALLPAVLGGAAVYEEGFVPTSQESALAFGTRRVNSLESTEGGRFVAVIYPSTENLPWLSLGPL